MTEHRYRLITWTRGEDRATIVDLHECTREEGERLMAENRESDRAVGIEADYYLTPTTGSNRSNHYAAV